MSGETAFLVVATAAALLALASAVVLIPLGRDRPQVRRLGYVVAAEALLLGFSAIGFWVESFARPDNAWHQAWLRFAGTGANAVAAALPWLYLSFLSALDTPRVAWLRRPGLRATVGAMTLLYEVAAITIFLANWNLSEPGEWVVRAFQITVVAGLVAVSAWGLVASLSTYRRAGPATLARSRAAAFALAFGVRDGLLVIWFAGIVVAGAFSASARPLDEGYWRLLPPSAVLLYVPLLAYGILKTQLFDLDLRLKVAVRRGTVAGLFIVTFVIAAEVAQDFVSQTYGWVYGAAATVLLLLALGPLQRLGRRMSELSFPHVDESAAYATHRKLGVYEAALQDAMVDGDISERERRLLDRLRDSLRISPALAARLEHDARRRFRSSGEAKLE